MRRLRGLGGACLALAALTAAGCVSPRYVTGISAHAGRMRFIYRSAGRSGIIECGVQGNGDLTGCVDRPVVFKG